MVKKAAFPLLMSVSLAGMLLAGCGTSSPANGSSPGSGAGTSGTLTIAEQADATKLDPQLGTDIPSANVYYGKIFEGLVTQDQNMNIVPVLATDWHKLNDTTYEFDLRKGVKFQDGTPFNAQAVKRTFERIVDPKTASPRKSQFTMVKEVKVIDDYKVQFVTSYSFAPLLANLAHYSAAIISPAAIDKYGNDLGQHPVGTGPFKFESWTPGQSITLSRNDDYWGQKAKVQKVVFKVVPEDSTRLAMLQTGEAQIADPVSPDDLAQLQNNPSVNLVRTPGLGNDYIGFNLRKKPFTDVRVRQAIAMAIDKDSIVKGVFNSVGSKAVGPMGPMVFGYDPNLTDYAYDVNKAKDLLNQAGYATGFTTTLWTNNSPSRTKLAEVVQSQLKGIGITVKIKVVDWGAYLQATGQGDDDMYILGWSNMTGDADYNQYFLFDSQAQGNTGNRSFYNNPAIDKLIQQGRQETDPAKRKAIYAQAQQIEMNDVPMVFVHNSEFLTATTKNVQGYSMSPSEIEQLNNVSLQ